MDVELADEDEVEAKMQEEARRRVSNELEEEALYVRG